MAAFDKQYYNKATFGGFLNIPSIAVYDGRGHTGNATIAQVSDADWWDGTLAANTGDGLSVGGVGTGVFVNCACSDGFAHIYLTRARQIGKVSGTALPAPYAGISDADVTADKYIVAVLSSVNTVNEAT